MRSIETLRRRLLVAAVLLTVALLLAALAGIASAQTPCGFVDTPDAGPLPWYTIRFGVETVEYTTCSPPPGTAPTPTPGPPAPAPDFPARSILFPIFR